MSEKPFWEGKTCKELDGLHVKITWNNGDTMTSTLNIFGNAGQCELSPARHPAATFAPYADIKSIELLDDPEYERIDNIEDVCEGDVYVAADGNKYTVISLTQSNLYPLRVMICKGTDYALPRDCFSHALRRKPKLPDKPGLWFDKEDTVWHFDGLFLRQLNDIEEAWSVTHVTRFAPFRPAKAVEA
ncbi:hypothetical protein [Bifidobacterium longum]|uniref:hypothetical protein n=1 Tax=Bifidobacterium longum TaxID=216816 RepID=UPI003984078B